MSGSGWVSGIMWPGAPTTRPNSRCSYRVEGAAAGRVAGPVLRAMVAIVRPAGEPSIRWPLVDRSSHAVNPDAAVERCCYRTAWVTIVSAADSLIVATTALGRAGEAGRRLYVQSVS